MNTIWKYRLDVTDRQTLTLPVGAKILSVGLDPRGIPSLWAEVDDAQVFVRYHTIVIVGTGHPCPPNLSFIGTVLDKPFVWHIFEEKA